MFSMIKNAILDVANNKYKVTGSMVGGWAIEKFSLVTKLLSLI